MSYPDRTLCPSCGRRFISRKAKSGFCRVCESERGVLSDSAVRKREERMTVWVDLDAGEEFDTSAEAGASIGVSGQAVVKAVNGGRPCQGHMFRKVRGDRGMRPYGGKVYLCVETGRRYKTAQSAARAMNCAPTNIYNAAMRGSKAAGYHWERVNVAG